MAGRRDTPVLDLKSEKSHLDKIPCWIIFTGRQAWQGISQVEGRRPRALDSSMSLGRDT